MWPLFVGLVGSGKFRITEHKTLTSRSSDLRPFHNQLKPIQLKILFKQLLNYSFDLLNFMVHYFIKELLY